MEYLLKASAVITLFYLSYYFFLRKDTFFNWNRGFLLLGLLSSVVIPLVVIPIYKEVEPMLIGQLEGLPLIESQDQLKSILTWEQMLMLVYLIGVTLLGINFGLELISILKTIIKNKRYRSGGLVYVETRSTSPCSFFNYIIYNPDNFTSSELELVKTHESVHAKQKHSIDTLLIQLACTLLWFNPIVWLYKKAIIHNLEFIADRVTQNQTESTKEYQHLLLKNSISDYHLALANTFYNSLIKKRIVMLHKNQSNPNHLFKVVLVLPLLAAFMLGFNTKTIAQQAPKDKSAKVVEIKSEVKKFVITKSTTDSKLDGLKEKLNGENVKIKFKGIKRNANDEITAININYESKNGKGNHSISTDKPISPIAITLDQDGNISVGQTNIAPHAIHLASKGDGTNKKVIRYEIKSDVDNEIDHDFQIIELSGEDKVIEFKGSDKAFAYTIDVEDDGVEFSSDSIIKKKVKTIIWNSNNRDTNIDVQSFEKGDNHFYFYSDNDSDNALILIDGKEVDKSEMKKLNSEDIETIEVLKGDKAIEEYGDKAEDGVIIIKTKK
ncbi:M56 family metallopeptidase [Mangrovimonas aestuarii]|uniref:M56 family metallopeptidase n=1 Tax=Mangrovimonas aestuarii TaxID=3018443 RepID=UPI0023794F0B|nr:M56 family metallopeptidase [Mangrovimonas aestuarii]